MRGVASFWLNVKSLNAKWDLFDSLSQLECGLAETKTQLNSEMLRRVDLENQVQTLREQLEFQRHIGEQVTHTLDKHTTGHTHTHCSNCCIKNTSHVAHYYHRSDTVRLVGC